MKVSAFLGSPRMGGNTEILVQEVLNGAVAEGAKLTLVNLNEKNIRGCQACMACRKTHRCALADDMQELYPLVQKADAIVIGTPIYFFQMTSQTKGFLDRLFCLYNPDNPRLIGRGKPAVLVVTQGAEAGVFKDYIALTRHMLEFVGYNVLDTVVAGGVGNRGDVRQQADVMEQAAKAGKALAEAIKAGQQ